MRPGPWLAIACLLAATGVAAGAFGAHALKDTLAASGSLENWHTAVRYQVWHALALALLALWRERHPGGSWAARLLLMGTLLFSGSIYLLALQVGTGVVWPFTPLGGLLLMIGWLAFAGDALRSKAPSTAR